MAGRAARPETRGRVPAAGGPDRRARPGIAGAAGLAAGLALLAAALPGRAAADDCVWRLSAVAEAEVSGEDSQPGQALRGCGALPEAQLELCLILAARGARAEADACADALSATAAAAAARPRVSDRAGLWAAEAHLAAGARALRDGEPEPARRQFEAALRADPGLAPARAGLVRSAVARGRPAEARAAAAALVARPGFVRRALDLDPDDMIRASIRGLESAIAAADPRCGECQGRLAYLVSRREEARRDPLPERGWAPAIAALRVVLEIAPRDFDSRLTLSDTLQAAGDAAAALTVLDEGLALRPDWPEGLLAAAQARARADQPERALPLLERATALAPGEVSSWFLLGVVRQKLGRPDAAAAFRRARALVKDPSGDALAAMGLAELDAGHWLAAREGFRRAVTFGDDAPPAVHFGLLRTSQLLGGVPDAEEARRGLAAALAGRRRTVRAEQGVSDRARSLAAALDALAAGRVSEAEPLVAAVTAADPKDAFLPFVRASLAAARRGRPAPADLDAVVRLCTAKVQP